MDALMITENQRALNLVPEGSFQAISTASGKWDDAATWKGGHVPANGDNVLISDGTTVAITADEAITKNADGSIARRAVNMMRVDGTLSFDTSPLAQNSNALRRLLADTIVVSPANMMMPDGKTPLYQNDDSTMGGTFNMGSGANDRMPYGVKADVVFADNGPVGASGLDPDAPQHGTSDPYELGRGLIVAGSASIFGSSVTSYATVAATAASGETSIGPSTTKNPVNQITLTSLPSDWHVGDRLIITGDTPDNSNNTNQDEQVAIAAIKGNTITINDPSNSKFIGLVYNHYAPAGTSIYVADVTRNVVLESESIMQHDPAVAARGHVMFMHTMNVQVDAAGFYGLGRTDKRTPINDPVPVQDYDANGNAIPGQLTDDVIDSKTHLRVYVPEVDANGNQVLDKNGNAILVIARTGSNPRGRYAVHFHHDMPSMDSGMGGVMGMPADSVNDSAVADSPGWGFVNHSSNVNITNNVAFNVVGASYATEAGDETGTFDHNIAIHAQGSGDGIEERQQFQDFGHQGDGFWFQGGNVSATNNVATGQRHSGFVFFPVGLDQKGLGVTTIPYSAVADQPWAAGYQTKGVVPVGDVPFRLFSGNVSFANGDGFESWSSLLNVNVNDPKQARQDVLTNLTVYTTGTGIFTPYSNSIVFDHDTVIRAGKSPGGTGFDRNDVTANATFDHDTVKNFTIGINAPINGTNAVIAGSFDNVENVYITTARSRNRVVTIDDGPTVNGTADPIQFLDTLKLPTGHTQYDVYLQSNFNPKERDITTLFNPDVIKMGTVKVHGKQIYYNEQAASFVPFPSASAQSYIPSALLDQTNQQIFSAYGLAIGGIVAPANARVYHRASDGVEINGLVGDPATYAPDLYLSSAKYSQFPSSDPNFAKTPLYFLAYRYADPTSKTGYTSVKETTGTQLTPGWNLLTRTIAGATRTLLVYGDDIAPGFTPDASVPWTINKADFDNNATWVLSGQITDDSFGSKFFRKNFTLGDAHFFSPITTNADGSMHSTFSMTITDYAGNKTVWTHDILITLTARLQQNLGQRNLPNIIPSETVIALIDSDPLIPPKKNS
jgi:hypothetical protein